ncbi:NAD-dependent epimerase/dehydratase family protein [Emticicia agri]|uniref:NAD(P)-dependent oxidoreductase n=1 Tax=Emticicia agri TaxID=2492393 RepID=A0A4Q5LVJ2_9BACT|nr:NAD(P)-dependent oxidoreductase [Emticicia agri]RYU93728.1 NAD(P)-dependent oxidoreductase [Emticicia agri]
MNRRVIITGGLGFIGQNIARQFKDKNYNVIAIGHNKVSEQELSRIGIDEWYEGDINLNILNTISLKPDLIIHCAGGSTVGGSLNNPYLDFHKTVNSTLDVLEYIRLFSPKTLLIYLSSAAVYGNKNDNMINEEDDLNPVSPYGFHKLAAENLCKSYASNFNVKVAIVRLFSIYGEGLKKQLLWEASKKIIASENEVIFFGTGEETRDWLHVKDVARLIEHIANIQFQFIVLNGGYGERIPVKQVLFTLLNELERNDLKIIFNNQNKPGDPMYYYANINKIKELGWVPEIDLSIGLSNYVKWFKNTI